VFAGDRCGTAGVDRTAVPGATGGTRGHTPVGAITGGTDQERQQSSFVLRLVGEVAPDALEPHRGTLETIPRDDADGTVREQTRGALDSLTD
jgi:hypothetical protein